MLFIEFFFAQSLEGISDIRDESDRSGMRIVIEVSTLTHALSVLLTILKLSIDYTYFMGANLLEF